MLSSQIDDLATKAQEPPTWPWKVFGAVLLMFGVWWLKYQLSQKAGELADAQTQLAINNLKAQQERFAAKLVIDNDKRKAAEAAALDALNKVKAEEKALEAVNLAHELNVAKLKAVADKDWAALNALAGAK